jgi:excisionase family DNA binding protein
MPGECGRPRNHVCKVGIFGGQIERPISAKCPSGPRLIKELIRSLKRPSPKSLLPVLRSYMRIVQDGVTVIVQPTLTFFRPVESLPQKPSGLMTTEEAAAYLRVHPDTLRKWVRLGKIPRVPMPGAGKTSDSAGSR